MKADQYYQFGYSRFGPFLYGFVRWLRQQLAEKGYDRIYFFSRDGYMMQQAFDRISDGTVRSHYVYFSRKALRTPLLCGCESYAETLRLLAWERYISVGKLLSFYGLEGEAGIAAAAACGLRTEDAFPYADLPQIPALCQLYEQNRAQIQAQAEEQDALLLQYLAQNRMHGKIAVADIGWYGNMQNYLRMFSQRHGLDLETEGFYLGIHPSPGSDIKANGYLFSPDRPANEKRMLCFFGGYEKLLQGFEGSAAGYVLRDGRAEARLARYEYADDERAVSAIRSWQRGALAFVKKAHTAGLADSDQMLTEPLIRFGMRPTLKDTETFSFFYLDDGEKTGFLPKKPLLQYHLREFIRDLSDSPWKTGFLKAAFRLPLPYDLVYRVLKR